MINKRALVEWIPKELGGRTKPPTGGLSPPYATVVRFPALGEAWPPPNAWEPSC